VMPLSANEAVAAIAVEAVVGCVAYVAFSAAWRRRNSVMSIAPFCGLGRPTIRRP